MPFKLVKSGEVRLSDGEIDQIFNAVNLICIKNEIEWITVSLFGSRIDISKKGGDIDLYVRVKNPLSEDNLVAVKAGLTIELCKRLGEQKFDIILDDGIIQNSFTKNVVMTEKVDLWQNR